MTSLSSTQPSGPGRGRKERPPGARTTVDGSVVDPESDLHHHLIMLYLAVLDMASDLLHFEPVEISHRLRSARNRGLDRIGDRGLGTADKFHFLVDMIAHLDLPGWSCN